jgi:hypothetical protein
MFLTLSSSSVTAHSQELALSLGSCSGSSCSSSPWAFRPQDCPCLLSDLHCCSRQGALQSQVKCPILSQLYHFTFDRFPPPRRSCCTRWYPSLGQNGGFTSSLYSGGSSVSERRPWTLVLAKVSVVFGSLGGGMRNQLRLVLRDPLACRKLSRVLLPCLMDCISPAF